MQGSSRHVSLIIPTLNRSDFVIRLLRYYEENDFRGTILLGDSSAPTHVDRVKGELARIGDKLKVIHELCLNMDTNATMRHLVAMIDTPYVAYIGDDDYLIPSTVDECVDFLDAHEDYVAAQGQARNFVLDKNTGAFGTMIMKGPYFVRGIEEQTAGQRLVWYMNDYAVSIFAVHRTDVWRRMWQDLDRVADRAIGAELLPCCLSVVLGKTKLLGSVYLLRQSHAERYDLPGFIDWVSHPDWHKSMHVFVESLADEIVRIDGTERGQAEALVKRMMNTYLFTDRGSFTHRIRRLRIQATDKARPYIRWAKAHFPLSVFQFCRRRWYDVNRGASFLFRAPFHVMVMIDKIMAGVRDVSHQGTDTALRKAADSAKKVNSDGSPS